jgi:hypothetical protein
MPMGLARCSGGNRTERITHAMVVNEWDLWQIFARYMNFDASEDTPVLFAFIVDYFRHTFPGMK